MNERELKLWRDYKQRRTLECIEALMREPDHSTVDRVRREYAAAELHALAWVDELAKAP